MGGVERAFVFGRRVPYRVFASYVVSICLDLYAFSYCTLLKFWVRSVGFARLLDEFLSAGCKSVIV